MTIEQTSSTEGVTPTNDTPVTGAPTSQSATPEKPALTLEAAMKRLEELEHSHKNAREQAERQAKKLTAYEKAEQEAKDAQLSEIERTKKQHSELQAQHEAYRQQAQERIVRYEVQMQAAQLGIIDPDAAVRLLDWSELEYEDDGTPKNTKTLLQDLIKKRPYLAPPAQQAQQEQPQQRQAPALPAMNPQRPQNNNASSLPPGKAFTLTDVKWSR